MAKYHMSDCLSFCLFVCQHVRQSVCPQTIVWIAFGAKIRRCGLENVCLWSTINFFGLGCWSIDKPRFLPFKMNGRLDTLIAFIARHGLRWLTVWGEAALLGSD
jgi:hypothetical protein